MYFVAIAFLEELGNDSWKYGVRPVEPEKSLLKTFKPPRAGLYAALRRLSSRYYDNETILVKFFEQDWFQRLWVVQEVALASRLTLYNALRFLGRENFARSITVLFVLRQFSGVDTPTWRKILGPFLGLVSFIWIEQKIFPTQSLVELMRLTRDKKYSNELDAVYGLLGLSRRYSDINVEVNYEMALSDLLISISYEYLFTGSLEVLRYIRSPGSLGAGDSHSSADKSTSHLPSWVCDFRKPRQLLFIRRAENELSLKRKVYTVLKQNLMPLIGIRGTMIDTTKLLVEEPALTPEQKVIRNGYRSHMLD